MPSGPKKRKSKQKNKAAVSPPHQSWLLSHMQMLKAPSFGNGTKGKEKHHPAESEAKGNIDKEGEKASFLFKAAETSADGKMDSFSSISTDIAQPEAKNLTNLDDLNMLPLEKSSRELQESNNSESAASNEFPEFSVTRDVKLKADSTEKAGEEESLKIFDVKNSFEDAITSQQESSLPAIKVVETGEDVVDKADLTPVLEAKESIYGKEDKLTADADDSIETVTPKTEIPHPPVVLHRASVWNCCGLLEVIKIF